MALMTLKIFLICLVILLIGVGLTIGILTLIGMKVIKDQEKTFEEIGGSEHYGC